MNKQRTLLFYPPLGEPRRRALSSAVGTGLHIINAETEEDALNAMPAADAFCGKLTSDLLAREERLEWVQSPTASLEHYLFPELIAHRCVLTNMRGLFSDVIADHVFAYVLCFCRNLHRYIRLADHHEWKPIGGESDRATMATGPSSICGFDRAHRHVGDQTLGVVGVGAIGGEICRRGAAFGMRVLGVDPHPRNLEGVVSVWGLDRLDELLSASDFTVIAAPHTPRTERLFDGEMLGRMKPASFLINIGRGAIVDLDALVAALDGGRLAGAALDVFEVEPLPAAHPLWGRENVIITPHVAAASPRIAERHFATLLENVRRFAAGEALLNVVDKREWY